MSALTNHKVTNEAIVVEEVTSSISPFAALKKLSHLPFPVFLDSSLVNSELGKASYVLADPFDSIIARTASIADLHMVDKQISKYRAEAVDGIPAFQGGVVNFCSYDLKRCFEEIPGVADEFHVPEMFVGFYDVVIIFDHTQDRSWIVSQGFPELELQKRKARAQQRVSQFKDLLQLESGLQKPGASTRKVLKSELFRQKESSVATKITSNFTKTQYISAVQRCIDYIYDGDIFQVNLSQRLLAEQESDSLSIYQNLREKNAATFAGYLDLGEFQILSSSPERLLSVSSLGEVETRPIKGTQQRLRYPEANLFLAEGLIASEKDRAENVMIVDLLRNDLSKICEDDSIYVRQLCGLEEYEFVQHLVSVIGGKLKCENLFADVFSAIFPGGSITGAPKVRAMEIIAEIEGIARGAYCGSMGYIGFDGAVDQNILIRTITTGRGWCQIPVGGGIVSQSDPMSEYEETIHKAHGMIRAIC